MIKILRINSLNEIKNETLHRQAERAHVGRSQEFIALYDENEAGLLSYEDWHNKLEGFIYEIYVLPEFRNKGIGSLLLSHAEKNAIHHQCTRIILKPFSLDRETKTSTLINWYKRNGYQHDVTNHEKLIKKLLLIRKA